MRSTLSTVCVVLAFVTALSAQQKRLWLLRNPGEEVEYDLETFAERQIVKIPAEALASPQDFSINRAGQMLFATTVALPLSDDLTGEKEVWVWNGHSATRVTRDVSRATATAGSNLAITESAPVPSLSADGAHLYWFSNQARRLQRDGVDLSTRATWAAWRSELDGTGHQEIASMSLPDCSCPTGGCEETCPYGQVWVPEEGVSNFFTVTQFVAGPTHPVYQSSSAFEEVAGKWTSKPITPPLRRVLDAANAEAILESVPDTGCCGWSNESDDQAVLRFHGKTVTMFDEREAYKNPNYDVSFYTENGKLSPDLASVAMTITATSNANQPIQLAEQGQANPEESQRIRKALLDLPAVEVKAIDSPGRLAYLPHTTLIGWISDKEILIVEDHVLVAYDVASGKRRRSNLRVDDAARAFLR